jgi:hypothetical protein
VRQARIQYTGGKEKLLQNCDRKNSMKETALKTQERWESNVKIDEGLYRVYLKCLDEIQE